jgi:hypothetical protein
MKNTEIHFQKLVENFCLAINMRMIGGDVMQLGSLDPKHLLPKIVGESWLSVKNNRMRHAMNFKDIIHENLSHYGCCEWILKRA